MRFAGRNVPHRHFWALSALLPHEALRVLQTAQRLKACARAGTPSAPLRGRNIALLTDRDEVDLTLHHACAELGAHVTRLDARQVAATGRLLGRLYDVIDCEGMLPERVAEIERESGVAVFNGLNDRGHPVRQLGALLCRHEREAAPLDDLVADLLCHASTWHRDCNAGPCHDNHHFALQAVLICAAG